MKPEFFITEDIYASRERRLANYVIDRIFLYPLAFFIGIAAVIADEMFGIQAISDFILAMSMWEEIVLGLFIGFLYYTLIEGLTGRSLGKYITRTKIINENGEKPDFADAILRSLCRMIPFEAFSFLGETGRGWHDSISKTYVVDIKKFENMKKQDHFNENSKKSFS